ncbi:Uncharacterised protein [Vibrio cholerae]|nr:Uncharacterised protein [Vibrio cholerae]CSA63300.1 Uncharacterised protein [Vibrio cholerae]
MSMLFNNAFLQCANVGCTDLVIDIQTIRLNAHRNDFRSQLTENIGRNVVCGTIGTIHNKLQTR